MKKFTTPLTADERVARIRHNCLHFKGKRLHPGTLRKNPISICGYGPSLADTYTELVGEVMTTSGAYNFLRERGITPRFHVECDPREHKVEFVRRMGRSTTCFINSQCHPTMFDVLQARGANVYMWHGYTDDDVDRQLQVIGGFEPGVHVLAGGTNVGLRAIMVARELGYTNSHLFGLDCCYRKGQVWAGPHTTPVKHHAVRIEVAGEEFETSAVMMHATDNFFNMLRLLPQCKFAIHGDGLLAKRLQLFVADRKLALSTEWWRPLSFTLLDENDSFARRRRAV